MTILCYSRGKYLEPFEKQTFVIDINIVVPEQRYAELPPRRHLESYYLSCKIRRWRKSAVSWHPVISNWFRYRRNTLLARRLVRGGTGPQCERGVSRRTSKRYSSLRICDFRKSDKARSRETREAGPNADSPIPREHSEKKRSAPRRRVIAEN